MIKVGITGQDGFIGSHLKNYLGLKEDTFEVIPFRDDYFSDIESLKSFVSSCDSVVHLAALNRHNDPEVIYNTNLHLVRSLLKACDLAGKKPHIIFASSIQEERDNLYGKSKKEGRELLADWSKKNKTPFTGLIIPNVFGPFGMPNYNSVITTFSHQLTHGEVPEIVVNGQIKLIYVGDLVGVIAKAIKDSMNDHALEVPHNQELYVSEILELLKNYKVQYFEMGIIPEMNSPFEANLFNTFRCYIDPVKHFPFKLQPHTDTRGTFVEVIKQYSGGQISFSTTKPGITRGNHFHTRKIERFAVIKGKARIQLRKIGTNEVINFELSGDEPSFVDMPIWYTHNITNTGSEDLYTIFWINEFYNPDDPDTYFEEV